MPRSILTGAIAAVFLLLVAGPSVGQEDSPPKKEVSQKFGFSFEHRGLQRLSTLPDVTLLDAYVDAEPGSFLEVEWLRPRDHAEYIKNLTTGMTILDLVPEKETEVALGGRKFAHVVFNSADKSSDTKAAIWIEKTEPDQWFFGVTVTGTDKDFAALKKAALSFSADMGKAPANPGKTQWVDRTFGFHIDLKGFKNAPKPWAEAILDMWSLPDDAQSFGSFFVKLIRPTAAEKFDDLMARVRKVQATNKRSITSDEAVKRGERDGRRMKIEFEQSGKKHSHDHLFLSDNGMVWQVVAAWRPDEAKGKEADLILAVDKFMPPTGKKAK